MEFAVGLPDRCFVGSDILQSCQLDSWCVMNVITRSTMFFSNYLCLFVCLQYGRGDHGRLGFGKAFTTGHPLEVPVYLPPPKEKVTNLSFSNEDEDGTMEKSGRWCATSVACGGRHTLAIATWKDDM